jgi:hypothetical protein
MLNLYPRRASQLTIQRKIAGRVAASAAWKFSAAGSSSARHAFRKAIKKRK